jgi:hypothetical protein
MTKIFICYRRSDSAGHAGRLYDRLAPRFGKNRVYMDIDSIPAGSDFVEEIQRTLNNCAAVIVLIGPQWFAGDNRARLTMPGDPVRQEISQALKSKAKVFPVLVHGARMPVEQDLPKDIQALARKHAIDLRDVSFDTDVQQVIKALERLDGLKSTKAAASKSAVASTRRSATSKGSDGNAGGTRAARTRKVARGAAAAGGAGESGKTGAGSPANRTNRGSTTVKPKQPKAGAKTVAKAPAPSAKTGGGSTPQKSVPTAPKKSGRKSASASGGTAGGGARAPKTSARNSGKRGARKAGASRAPKGGRGGAHRGGGRGR